MQVHIDLQPYKVDVLRQAEIASRLLARSRDECLTFIGVEVPKELIERADDVQFRAIHAAGLPNWMWTEAYEIERALVSQ